MGLLDIFKRKKIPEIYYNEDEITRANAVHDEDDQYILKYIANKDKSIKVKRVALQKIDDVQFIETWLSKNRVTNGSVNLWYGQVVSDILHHNKNLTNEFYYNRAMDSAGKEREKAYGVEKITDENLLKKIAINSKDYLVRWAALENPYLKDNDFLIHIIDSKRTDNYDRAHALSNPNINLDDDKLKRLAKYDGNPRVREKAVNKIDDVNLLKDIALHDNYESKETMYGTKDDQYEVSTGYPVRMAAKRRLEELSGNA